MHARLCQLRELTFLLIVSWFSAGCDGARYVPSESAGANNSGAAVKLKTTDKVEEFKADAGKEIVSNKVVITNPITGPLEAYQPMKQQIAALGIEHAVNLFNASEGRYPKDFDEFKGRIIDENKMRLPSLPKGLSYQYDVENHKLVVVRDDTGKPVE